MKRITQKQARAMGDEELVDAYAVVIRNRNRLRIALDVLSPSDVYHGLNKELATSDSNWETICAELLRRLAK